MHCQHLWPDVIDGNHSVERIQVLFVPLRRQPAGNHLTELLVEFSIERAEPFESQPREVKFDWLVQQANRRRSETVAVVDERHLMVEKEEKTFVVRLGDDLVAFLKVVNFAAFKLYPKKTKISFPISKTSK